MKIRELFPISEAETEKLSPEREKYAKVMGVLMSTVTAMEKVDWMNRDRKRLEDVLRSMVVTVRDWSRSEQALAREAAGSIEVEI